MNRIPVTYRAAQAQASLALHQYRETNDAATADLLMTRAQLLIAHAIRLDDRPRPTGWDRYQGDGRRPR